MSRHRVAYCAKCGADRLVVFARQHVNGRWRRVPCCHLCGERVEPAPNKHQNIPTRTVEGKLRHSRKEARREDQLKLEERLGAVSEVRSQVPYKLEVYSTPVVDALLEAIDGDAKELARLVADVRRARHRICAFVADHVYISPDGREVVEDTKGRRSMQDVSYRIFQLKKKLMLACYGVEVQET